MQKKSQGFSIGREYRQSFQDLWQPRTFILIFYDILFYALFFLSLVIYGRLLTILAENLSGVGLDFLFEQEAITGTALAAVEAQASTMQQFLVAFLVVSIIVILLLIAFWSLSRGLLWCNLLKRKFDIAFFKKFYPMNILWAIFFFAAFSLTLYAVQQFLPFRSFRFHPVALMVTLGIFSAVALYFTELLYYRAVKEPGILVPIKQALSLGFHGNALFPFLFVILTFAILALLSYLLKPLQDTIETYVSFALLLIFFAWMRYYLVRVYQKLNI